MFILLYFSGSQGNKSIYMEYLCMPPLCCTTISKYLEEFSGDGRKKEELGGGWNYLPFFFSSSYHYLLAEFCSPKSRTEPVSYDLQLTGMFYLANSVFSCRSWHLKFPTHCMVAVFSGIVVMWAFVHYYTSSKQILWPTFCIIFPGDPWFPILFERESGKVPDWGQFSPPCPALPSNRGMA